MRHGRGNILYVRFTPRPLEDEELEAQERRSTVFGAVAVLALIMLALSIGLYLVLAPVMAPRATMTTVQRTSQQRGGTPWSGEPLKARHGASGAVTGASGACR